MDITRTSCVTVTFCHPPSTVRWDARIPIDGADTIGGPRRRTPRPT